ncbi:heme-thiolate peroxidase [Dentipellis fragilis]|uniref:Heme-thiolate peroxidase n=1 Tax=Dentipellis fragilis TaxID=205917 RepID=A0A4Y9XTA5_9AGAM|nr:heme-thiolate peroxidase [Dentipellis fragilis]
MPSVAPHSHSNNSCPVTGQSHGWCPAQAGDSRAPCPALNTLANHGYLPRNGEGITPTILMKALQEVYGVSDPLKDVLGYGGVVLLGQLPAFSLGDLARHGRIEHNASIIHKDADGKEYAPTSPDKKMLDEFLGSKPDGSLVTIEDVAAIRVKREDSYKEALDALHAEIARGEMAIVMNIFGEKSETGEGVPVERLRSWLAEERLPEGWSPSHVAGLFDTIQKSGQIRKAMEKIRADANEAKKDA